MKCSNCGFVNEEGAVFCVECGVQLPDPSIEVESAKVGKTSRFNKRERVYENFDPAEIDVRHPFARLLSLVLALLMFFGACASTLLYITRKTTDDEHVERVYEAINLPTTRLGTIAGTANKSVTLAEFIADAFQAALGDSIAISVEGVKSLLSEPETEAFFIAKTKDFIHDFFEDTGKGSISAYEALKLLEGSPSTQLIFGINITENEIQLFEPFLQASGMFARLSLKNSNAKWRQAVVFLASPLGVQCQIILYILAALAIVLINKHNRISVLKYFGTPLIIIGAFGLIVSLLITPVTQFAVMSIKFDFLYAAAKAVSFEAILFYVYILAAGIIMASVYGLVARAKMGASKRRMRKAERRATA